MCQKYSSVNMSFKDAPNIVPNHMHDVFLLQPDEMTQKVTLSQTSCVPIASWLKQYFDGAGKLTIFGMEWLTCVNYMEG